MPSHMILPVAGLLKEALAKAHALVTQPDQRNDRDAYLPTVEVLSELTSALLGASSGSFLLVRPTIGARFDMGPDTRLARKVDETVGYLREIAAPLITGNVNRLAMSYRNRTDVADGYLKVLYGELTASILALAIGDLGEIRSSDPTRLVDAAETLYGLAYPRPKDEATVTASTATRPVTQDWNPAG